MSATSVATTTFALGTAKKVYWNLTVPELVELALARGEGVLAANGALVARTGKFTGRTPQDKHTVRDAATEGSVWWDNNAAMDPETFSMLLGRANEAMANKELFVVDTYGGADPNHRIKVRFIVENAYHALFVKQLLIRPTRDELNDFRPDWTVVDLCREGWERDGREAVIALNMGARTVLIMGTFYAGEMKKSVFTVMNYLLPLKGVLSMHCSANVGPGGDTALFFGLSGTGKTTLSTDPNRRLIGDDEHGWTDSGVFNIEGGCYAKCIKLDREGEPQIWNAIKFGSVLENVVLDAERQPDYDDASITENTRCAYPLDHIEGAVFPSVGSHPKNIFFLTCDAFGVLPPVSRLSKEQAMYHFLNGYTAKVAGTEAGVTEPQLTFSTCFGAPFLPLHPSVYAKLLGERLDKHGSQVWLLNTGWTGGPYGVGRRMELAHTRAMIQAALEGRLQRFKTDHVFGLDVPVSCPDVPDGVLDPRNTWTDKGSYDAKANELKAKFEANFRKYKG
jgi:phosphoenolpyruvate carboxykinase (ATP)